MAYTVGLWSRHNGLLRRRTELTHTASYVDNATAFANGLAYVSDRGTIIMKGDNTTWLAAGANRQRYEGTLDGS